MDMSDFQKAVDKIIEVWEEVDVSIKKILDALEKTFELLVSEKEKKKNLSSPARYGMSLQKSRRQSFINRYSYRPVIRKNLPYQRRNF